MDTSYYNERIVSKISTLVPPHIKLADYLIDVLGIGRESAYRRLRGQVPFSLEEVALLSTTLCFSVDEIIGSCDSDEMLMTKSLINPEQSVKRVLLHIMENFYKHIERGSKANDMEIIVSNNRLLFLYFINHLNILKFFYYKCCRQNNDISLNTLFSEISLPDEIVDMAKKIVESGYYAKREIFIIDENIYLSVMKEIQYAYLRKLITEDELTVLKEEFFDFLQHAESLNQAGGRDERSKVIFYLSSVHIGNNQLFLSYGDYQAFIFFISTFLPIYVTDPNLCKLQKKWLESQKLYSTMIAMSNEIHQAEFFTRQYEHLKKVGVESF